MKKQEINSLTGLRGIAAIMVMFYHFNTSILLSPGRFCNILHHGYLMVDLFLVLSGFIIALTYQHYFIIGINWQIYKKFLIRRIARIYPLYILMTVTAAILVATGWMDHWAGPKIPVSTLIDFTMLQSILHVPSLDTPGWSVSAEWIVNLLFPILAIFCLYRGKFWLYAAAVISCATLLIIPHIAALINEPKRAGLLDIWNYETIYPVIRCLADFTLGIVTYRISALNWIQRLIGFNFIAPIILIGLLFLMSIKGADIWIVLLFPVFILALISPNNIVAKFMGSPPLHKLGEISYSIYLIHNQMNYFILRLSTWLAHYIVSINMAHLLAILVFVFIVVVLAYLSYHFIEMPSRSYINNFTAKKSERSPVEAVMVVQCNI